MKKTIVAIVLVLTLALGLCACGAKEQVKEYTSSEDFAEFGISLVAPEGASNHKYGVVTSKVGGEELTIAQIEYTYNDIACVLRCAAAIEHNVSGYDENKAQNEEQYDLNIENYSSQIRVMQIDGKYVAIWTLGDFSYSLSAQTDDPIVATSCAMDAANANVPAGATPVATTDEEESADTQSDETEDDTASEN
ncbi:MAG: hypothetical protein IJG23_05400 [Clostridia bacterium]|nr:hypothetical protein [Clostridia bacterium]